jgi:hypothetical protein
MTTFAFVIPPNRLLVPPARIAPEILIFIFIPFQSEKKNILLNELKTKKSVVSITIPINDFATYKYI